MATPAKKPATLPPDEPLEPTSVEQHLRDLPDEAVVEIDLDQPGIATAGPKEDEPEDNKGSEAAPGAAAVGEDGSSETLAALRKQIEDNDKAAKERIRQAEQNAASERSARQVTEQQAREREAQHRQELGEREMSLITTGIDNTTAELGSLEEELTRLNEAGEFAKAARVQTKIAKAAATLDRLEAAKADLEATATRAPASVAETQPAAGGGDQVEKYLATFAPQSANWLRQHRECLPPELGGNRAKNAKMMQGHWAALEQGHQPNTDDYFKVIDNFLEPPAADPAPEAQRQLQQRQPGQRKPVPSARPAGTVPGATATPGRTRSVSLSKEQQEAALLSFPHMKPQEALAEYARNLVALESEGKMGRTNV